jgi:para-nitrobenzyl esterase
VTVTADGAVRGRLHDGVRVFTALPFAAAPTGPLRFRAPRPVARWPGVRDATQPAPSCPQAQSMDPAAKASEDEDCLYLNVWARSSASRAKPMPVMVWIHGGGFTEGWSGAREYDGTRLAQDGVVVVGINYRLGLLGSLMSSALDGGEPSGNYGLQDQQAALRWVQRNIAAFGGNPKNVTVFGESAGGQAILSLLASPASKGLFHKAIVQSAGYAHMSARAEVDAGPAKRAIEEVGCSGRPDVAECLRAAPVSAFLKAKTRIGAVQDDKILPVDPREALSSGRFNRVPVLMGTNLLEGNFFVASSERSLGRRLTEEDYAREAKTFFGAQTDAVLASYPSSRFGSPAAALGQAETDYRHACAADMSRRHLAAYVPVYGYEMNEGDPVQQQPRREVTELPNTDYHTSDLAYVFDVDSTGARLTGRAGRLSARFRRYWTTFAKTGAPAKASEWPRFTKDRPVLLGLSEPPATVDDFTARHRCTFMWERGLVTAKAPADGTPE